MLAGLEGSTAAAAHAVSCWSLLRPSAPE
jgi:hypothetical protein